MYVCMYVCVYIYIYMYAYSLSLSIKMYITTISQYHTYTKLQTNTITKYTNPIGNNPQLKNTHDNKHLRTLTTSSINYTTLEHLIDIYRQ